MSRQSVRGGFEQFAHPAVGYFAELLVPASGGGRGLSRRRKTDDLLGQRAEPLHRLWCADRRRGHDAGRALAPRPIDRRTHRGASGHAIIDQDAHAAVDINGRDLAVQPPVELECLALSVMHSSQERSRRKTRALGDIGTAVGRHGANREFRLPWKTDLANGKCVER